MSGEPRTITGSSSVVWTHGTGTRGQSLVRRLAEWWAVAHLLGSITGRPTSDWAEQTWTDFVPEEERHSSVLGEGGSE